MKATTKQTKAITEEELELYAVGFLYNHYKLDLTVPVKINNRLKSTYGRFSYYGGWVETPRMIEISGFFVRNNSRDIVFQVLAHELIHYALFMLDRDHDDGDFDFENELKRLKVVSQSNIHELDIVNVPKKEVIYQCMSCARTITRQRKLPNDGKDHHCTACGREHGNIKRIIRN